MDSGGRDGGCVTSQGHQGGRTPPEASEGARPCRTVASGFWLQGCAWKSRLSERPGLWHLAPCWVRSDPHRCHQRAVEDPGHSLLELSPRAATGLPSPIGQTLRCWTVFFLSEKGPESQGSESPADFWQADPAHRRASIVGNWSIQGRALSTRWEPGTWRHTEAGHSEHSRLPAVPGPRSFSLWPGPESHAERRAW